jgi:8-oxo-dGTP pyrophosphatase MutT (NUDIX family)/diadenosine tetraphosphate (Ap4A) HIT family hydrolase
MSRPAKARTWPDDWEARRAGDGCPMCAEGSRERNSLGDLRILGSAVCDAYLRRVEIVRGYAVAVWRGRHVAELTELSDAEATEFDRSVRVVARALEAHYRPAKLNFLALGNQVPHLHVHIVPRYVTDPDPARPPRFMMAEPRPGHDAFIPHDVYLADVAALRGLVEDMVAPPAELARVARVAVGAAAAILDGEGRILLVRHGYGRHNWELPGGAAEIGESPEQTAVREVAEETGLTIVPERVTGIYTELGHRLGPTMHFVVRCRREPADAEPRIASDEITDLAWVEPSSPPRPISDFTIRRILDAIASRPVLPALISGRVWLDDADAFAHR